ncbi:MAG: hypothetical protein J6N52_02150, partial [Clostridia bacterium]|nr:hypothetical protein [Clostridia bacterium]
MLKKKIFSFMLALSIFSGIINPVMSYHIFADAADNNEIFDESELETDDEIVVTEHIESIPAELTRPVEEDEDEKIVNMRETGGVSTFSSLITSNKTLWEEM